MGTYENNAGLGVRNHYGPKVIDEGSQFGGQISTSGGEKEASWVFGFDDLPVATGAEMETFIPEGSILVSAKIQVITAFGGGTDYDIGLEENDNSAIDANGLWDALLVAEINVINEWSDAVTHTGTDSGTLILQGASQLGLSEDAYLLVVENGTFTAGKARIIIRYKEADFDPTGNYTAGGVKGAG